MEEEDPGGLPLTLEAIYDELRHLDAIIYRRSTLDVWTVDESETSAPTDEDVRRMQERREALRSRALELSRDGIRPLNIFDLPMEILREVCTFAPRRKLRLVCRLFRQIVSPLMYPTLRIRLSEESLDRAESICNKPEFASGVRRVIIQLDYRPKKLALDRREFVAVIHKRVHAVKRALQRHLERLEAFDETLRNPDNQNQSDLSTAITLQQAQHERRTAALSICSSVEDSCQRYLSDNGMEDDSGLCDETLREIHRTYQNRHNEQFYLVISWKFVSAVAALLVRLPCPITFHFDDQNPRDGSISTQSMAISIDPLNRLSAYLQSGYEWREIESMSGAQELTAAKVLWSLPIASYKAGVPLRDIKIHCFPTISNFSMLLPESWDDLRAACQNLHRFTFDPKPVFRKPRLAPSILPTNCAHIDGYFKAILSSHTLVHVIIDLCAFCQPFGLEEESHHLGHILQKANLGMVTKLELSAIALNERELRRFCNNLGRNIESMYLQLMLSNGTWARAMYTLREKLSSRCSSGTCTFDFWPQGGEFDRGRGEGSPGWMAEYASLYDNNGEGPNIRAKTIAYVTGAQSQEDNPLRQL